MFFSFFIAKKYQVFKSKNNFVNLASKVSMFGIAIGTAALIIVLSVFNGFENLIVGMYNVFDPHLKVTHVEGKSFNPDSIKNKLKDDNIFNISSVLEEKVLLKYKDKEHIATIKGVSKNYNDQVSIDSLLIQGNYINDYENSNVCIIGSGVAYHLSILSGSIFETIKVFLPNRNASNLLNPLTAFKTSNLLPTGVFSIQSEIDDSYIISPIKFVQDLTDKEYQVTHLEIKLIDNKKMFDTQEKLKNLTGKDYIVENRFEQQKFLYKILNTEKLFVFIILIFIMIIASFNIVGASTMLIIDKKKNIQTFKSMGASCRKIQLIFFINSILNILLGITIGLIFSLVFGALQQKFGFISMGSGNFVIDAYPLVFSVSDILYVLISIFIIGLISSWYPSFILVKRFFQKNKI